MRWILLTCLVMANLAVGSVAIGSRSASLNFSPAALAQEVTPAASPVAAPDFLQRMIDGVNTGDGAAIAALYTEDGIYEDIQSGAVAHGREEIAAFIEQSDAIFTDVEILPITVHAGDGWAAYEYVYTATVAKSGARLEIRGATFYVLEDGLIRHSTDYYALPTAKQQE